MKGADSKLANIALGGQLPENECVSNINQHHHNKATVTFSSSLLKAMSTKSRN